MLADSVLDFYSDWKVAIQSIINLKERIRSYQATSSERLHYMNYRYVKILASEFLHRRADIVTLNERKRVLWSQTTVFHEKYELDALKTQRQDTLLSEEVLDDNSILEMFITELGEHWDTVCAQIHEEKVI